MMPPKQTALTRPERLRPGDKHHGSQPDEGQRTGRQEQNPRVRLPPGDERLMPALKVPLIVGYNRQGTSSREEKLRLIVEAERASLDGCQRRNTPQAQSVRQTSIDALIKVNAANNHSSRSSFSAM
jgi:hypothetical protein